IYEIFNAYEDVNELETNGVYLPCSVFQVEVKPGSVYRVGYFMEGGSEDWYTFCADGEVQSGESVVTAVTLPPLQPVHIQYTTPRNPAAKVRETVYRDRRGGFHIHPRGRVMLAPYQPPLKGSFHAHKTDISGEGAAGTPPLPVTAAALRR